jgi:hypothetical protein
MPAGRFTVMLGVGFRCPPWFPGTRRACVYSATMLPIWGRRDGYDGATRACQLVPLAGGLVECQQSPAVGLCVVGYTVELVAAHDHA